MLPPDSELVTSRRRSVDGASGDSRARDPVIGLGGNLTHRLIENGYEIVA